MAGDQDRFTFFDPQRDLGGYGMSISSRIPGIKKLHGAEVDFAAFQNKVDPVLKV